MPSVAYDARSDDLTVSENEGLLLGLAVRLGRVTAHQLFVIHERSPLGSINASKGSVYPMVRRLKERGLLVGTPVEGDGRNTETLTVTEAGVEALRRWVTGMTPDHTLTSDPLRTRVMSLHLLDREERIRWVAEAKQINAQKVAEVRDYADRVKMPFGEVVHGAALAALEAQSRWLDQLLMVVVKDEPQETELRFTRGEEGKA